MKRGSILTRPAYFLVNGAVLRYAAREDAIARVRG